MIKLFSILTIICFLFSCGGGGSDSTDGTVDQWEFAPGFSDEFDGVQLDDTKWWDHNPHWDGRFPGLFCPENVWVRNGNLNMRISYDEDLPDDYIYACAAVKSKEPLLYWKLVAMIKIIDVEAASGFWLYNDGQNEWTELGVLETHGGNLEWESLVCFSSFVWEPYYYHENTCYETDERLADGFHVYGIEWTPFEVRRYFDGILIDTIDNEHWHQPLYVNFDIEVWDWIEMPGPEDLPKIMLIDWIRAYYWIDPLTT